MDKKSLFNSLLNVAKVATPAIVTESVYEKMFNHHFFSFKPLWFTMDDYKDLARERHTFYSYSKNKLVDYIYQTKTGKKKGIFVFAHGYGGGGSLSPYYNTNGEIMKYEEFKTVHVH